MGIHTPLTSRSESVSTLENKLAMLRFETALEKHAHTLEAHHQNPSIRTNSGAPDSQHRSVDAAGEVALTAHRQNVAVIFETLFSRTGT